MSRREDLAQWPCSCRKLLGRDRVNLCLQRTRDEMRSGRHGLGKQGPHRVQEELLCGVGAQNVHAHRRREHAARVKKEV
jgi:hypothetical protein